MHRIEGVLLPGVDDLGVLGTPGADLAGVPFAYSLYYRPNDRVWIYATDFDAPVIRTSGQIGSLRIPYQSAQGTVSFWEPPEVPYSFSGFTNDYPEIRGHDCLNPEAYTGCYPYAAPFVEFYAPPSIGGAKFASGDIRVHNIAYFASSVPEPSTWLLLLTGFGAIGSVIRKRKTKTTVSYRQPARNMSGPLCSSEHSGLDLFSGRTLDFMRLPD